MHTISGALPAQTAQPVDFVEVYQHHHERTLRFAYLLTGNRDDAMEVTAEAFARMLVPWRLGRVREPQWYVQRTVLNLVRDRARSGQARQRREQRVAVSDSVGGEEGAITDQLVLQDALLTLTPRQRAVVVMRHYEDHSEQEIADALRMRPGTVKSTLSRALAQLRTQLTGQEAQR